jgi:hypothetical protein
MEPPQLVLKGAWGSFLLAFGVALVVSFGMVERGWMVVLLAWMGFFTAYYEGSPPFFWRKRKSGAFLSACASTWIPFFVGKLVAGTPLTGTDVGLVLSLYVLRIFSSICDSSLR